MTPHRTKVPAMRSLHVILLLAVLWCLIGATGPGTDGPQPPGSITPNSHAGAEGPDSTFRPFVPNEVIVKLYGDTVSIDSINSLYGTTVKDYFDRLNIYILNTHTGADIEALVENLRRTPGVAFAHPNYVVSPLQSVQGSFPFSDADLIGTYPDQDAAVRLRLSTAHALSSGTGVKVGVIDGGVNFSHPQLAGSVVSGWDYVDNDADAFDEPGGSNTGHGSFVAGVIHLAAPDAQIIAYRVADTSGESHGDIVAEAILRAIDDGCRVINLSLVMTSVHEVLRNALAYARSQDVMVVTAAGNGSLELPTYPASDPNVIAVAAVDTLDRLAEFSRYGTHIDVCAPGQWVYSPYDNIYAWWSGTSFAAPFVAGQVALKLSQSGGTLDWRGLHASLIATAENINAQNPGYFGKIGAGLIDPVQSLLDTVAIDTASVDPVSLFLTLPPDETVQRCFNLYSTNPNSVFSATVLGGSVVFTTIAADSVLEANSTICFTMSSTGLGEGIYADTIQFDISGVSNSPFLVPVYLTVSDTMVASEDASVFPAGHSYWLPEGWTQTVDACSFLSSTNAPAPFTVRLSDTVAVSFIEIIQSAGTTNDSVCFYLHPAGLAPGTYCDTLIYSINGVPYDVFQPVCLTIGDQEDSASVLPAYFYFASDSGGAPQIGHTYLTSTNAPAQYTLTSGSNWLHPIDSVGITNDSIRFAVDPVAAFAPGIFVDTIFCHVVGAANTPAIVVTLDVGGGSASDSAAVWPNFFEFTTAPWSGGPAKAGSFVLYSSNAPAAYTAEVALGSSWLHVVDSAGMTNDSVRFTVDGIGLAPGLYHDSIVCHVNGVQIPASVLISLTVLDDSSGTDPMAYVNPEYFHFVTGLQARGPIQAGAFTLSSTNAPATFAVQSFFHAPWLTVHDSAGVTNDSVWFTIDATGLPPGFYNDSLLCFVEGVQWMPTVTVYLTVVDDDTLGTDTAAAWPSSFDITLAEYTEIQQVGCFLVFASNAPAPFTAGVRNGSPWLSLLTAWGTANDSVCFAVTASGLGQGVYADTIDCIIAGVADTLAVPVDLTVTGDSSGTVATAWASPPDQHLFALFGNENLLYGSVVLSSSNAPAAFSANVVGGSAWLSLMEAAGVTNDSVRFVVNPAAPFSAGTFEDTIACTVSGAANPVMVPVALTLITWDSSNTASITPSVLAHTAMYGATATATRCVLVTSSNAPAYFSARHADVGATFTSMPTPDGITNDSLCVLIDPIGLSVGVHVDTIAISVSGCIPILNLTVELSVEMPKFADVQNYPNPFNPETQISFTLAAAARVNVSVYNTLGQRVAELLDSHLEAGRHTVPWRGQHEFGREVSSGVYLYRITSEGSVVSRKMLLLK